MLNDIIKKFLFASFKPAYDGEEGAVGTGGAGDPVAVANDGEFVPSESSEIEQEFLQHMAANDPEYQELLELEKKPTEGDGEGEQDGDDDGDGEVDKKKQLEETPESESLPPGGAEEGDNWIDAEGNEYTFKEGKWTDDGGKEFAAKKAEGETDENAGGEETEGHEEDFEYPDDVIPGLKGKDFSTMPKEAQEAIARHHQEYLDFKKNNESDIKLITALKNDPIAKHRIDVINQGRGNFEYQVPNISKEDAEKILDAQTPEQAQKLIDSAAKRIAKVVVDNERIREEQTRKIKKANEEGEKILLEAGNLHPDLYDEKNKIDKRLKTFDGVDKSGAPEKEIYDNFHQKIVDYCTSRGLRYGDIAKMKPTELYALVGVNEGWPIAFNTKKRDTKMMQENTLKALQHFRVSKRGKEIARGMRKVQDTSGKSVSNQPFKIKGIDVVRLHRDDAYHDSVLNMKPGNTAWIDDVREMRMKGEEIIERRKRKREKAERRSSTAE